MRQRRSPSSREPRGGKNAKRINEAIQAREVLAISEDWENLGTMLLTDAIARAEEEGVDVVEIGLKEWKTMVKLMDYGKYLFKMQKQQSNSNNKANAKKTEVKTIRITYKIGDHDLEIRKNQALRFAEDGHPLKIILQLRGRENQYSDLAVSRIKEFIQLVSSAYKYDGNEPTKQWNTFDITLYPKK